MLPARKLRFFCGGRASFHSAIEMRLALLFTLAIACLASSFALQEEGEGEGGDLDIDSMLYGDLEREKGQGLF